MGSAVTGVQSPASSLRRKQSGCNSGIGVCVCALATSRHLPGTMMPEDDTPPPSAGGPSPPGSAPGSGPGLPAAMASCGRRGFLSRGRRLFPVCTAAVVAGSVFEMRTRGHWNSRPRLFPPLGPTSGGHAVLEEHQIVSILGPCFAFLPNRGLCFPPLLPSTSSSLNRDKMFPVFLGILLVK